MFVTIVSALAAIFTRDFDFETPSFIVDSFTQTVPEFLRRFFGDVASLHPDAVAASVQWILAICQSSQDDNFLTCVEFWTDILLRVSEDADFCGPLRRILICRMPPPYEPFFSGSHWKLQWSIPHRTVRSCLLLHYRINPGDTFSAFSELAETCSLEECGSFLWAFAPFRNSPMVPRVMKAVVQRDAAFPFLVSSFWPCFTDPNLRAALIARLISCFAEAEDSQKICIAHSLGITGVPGIEGLFAGLSAPMHVSLFAALASPNAPDEIANALVDAAVATLSGFSGELSGDFVFAIKMMRKAVLGFGDRYSGVFTSIVNPLLELFANCDVGPIRLQIVKYFRDCINSLGSCAAAFVPEAARIILSDPETRPLFFASLVAKYSPHVDEMASQVFEPLFLSGFFDCRLWFAFVSHSALIPFELPEPQFEAFLQPILDGCQCESESVRRICVETLAKLYLRLGDREAKFGIAHLLFMVQLALNADFAGEFCELCLTVAAICKLQFTRERAPEVHQCLCEIFPVLAPEQHEVFVARIFEFAGNGDIAAIQEVVADFFTAVHHNPPPIPKSDRREDELLAATELITTAIDAEIIEISPDDSAELCLLLLP
jgi:hypothetical protein